MPSQQTDSSHAPHYRDNGGLYCYLATPYNMKGDVDAGLLAEYASEIVRSGVTGVTCVASTCEGPYLSDAERNLVLDTVGKAVGGRVKINAGIAAISTRQAIANAMRAKDAGATSLMLEMQQYFPVTFDVAYKHYEMIADAVDMPIRLYNLPVPTHFDFVPKHIFMMGSIAAIASIKEASGDVRRLRDIRSLCGDRFSVYCGFHYQALDGFRFGADGWEVMMHPKIADHLTSLYAQLSEDPWSQAAEKLYGRLQALFYFFKEHGVPQSIKAISEQTDLKLGKPRMPLQELSPAAKARLDEIVATLDAG